MKIEPRHLVHIAAIVDARTFALAAEKLGTTQPALSRTVAEIERRTGTPLFERGRRPLVPTEVGRALADQGRAIRAATNQATSLLERMSEGDFGTVRLGAPPFLCDRLLSGVIARFLATHQGVRIVLTPEFFPSLQVLLISDQFDAIVGPMTLVDRSLGLHIEELTDDANVIVCRSQHPLAKRRRVTVADLEASRWISHSTASTLHTDMQAALTAAGVARLSFCFESSSAGAVVSVLLGTDSLTMLPRNAVAELIADRQIKVLPFQHLSVARPIGIITLANRIPSAALVSLKAVLRKSLGTSWSAQKCPTRRSRQVGE